MLTQFTQKYNQKFHVIYSCFLFDVLVFFKVFCTTFFFNAGHDTLN